jgi:CubicO group peptidase (beta-lactamase class C family)
LNKGAFLPPPRSGYHFLSFFCRNISNERMKHLLISLLIIGGFGLTTCRDEAPTIANAEEFDAFVQKEMEEQDIPALSVLVFRENEVLHERYFGKADLSQGPALADNHLFLLASVSKVVTAVALLQLYDQGHFQLDDKINDYLPFAVTVPGENKDITFRMLLTHTSGIADGSALDDQYYYGQDSPVALADFMENYLAPNGQFYNVNENFHDFEPGTQHEYANAGSALIGVLVETISGMEFNAYCKANIFAPLGMGDTFWRLDEINQPIARPYDLINGNLQAIEHYTFTDYPNGGLRSTGRDLYKLLHALSQGGISGGVQLLKPGTVEAMLTPQIPAIEEGVGLHLFLMDASFGLWGHDGGEQGVSTIMAFNPVDKTGAIILSNLGDAELDEMLRQAYLLGKKL